MKFVLLLYLIYYLIEDSNSFKDADDIAYPRVYYLKSQDLQSSLKQKSKVREDLFPKKKRNAKWSILTGSVDNNKDLAALLRNINKLSKPSYANSDVKKSIKISRSKKNVKAKAESTKNNKRIRSRKIKSKGNKRNNVDKRPKVDDVSTDPDEFNDKEYLNSGEVKELEDQYHEEQNNAGDDDNQVTPGIAPQQLHGKPKLGHDWPDNYQIEIQEGDLADLVPNKHRYVPMKYAYNNLGRRFVFQYPYTEVHKADSGVENTAEFQLDEAIKEALQQGIEDEKMVPMRASPELVLSIAKQSAILEASKPVDPTREIMQNNLLRTGDYWNTYWKEDVPNPQDVSLRSEKNLLHPKLETVRVKIMPGSTLYQLVTLAKKVSPRLLYIINANKDD